MEKILIIQTAFLGDVILATPVISELNRLYPFAQIDVLVKKGNESLLANNPKINKVHDFDKSNGKWKNIIALIKQFRSEKFNLVINLHRFASSGIIAGFSNGEKRYGFKKNPLSFLNSKSFDHSIGDGTHEVTRNLSMIKEFGANMSVRPELFPSLNDIEVVQKKVHKKYFCLAPASVWHTKQLPIKKWIELINSFPGSFDVFLLGGPDDYDLCASIQKLLNNPNSATNLCGELFTIGRIGVPNAHM